MGWIEVKMQSLSKFFERLVVYNLKDAEDCMALFRFGLQELQSWHCGPKRGFFVWLNFQPAGLR
jgi:hypothetical protein